MTMRNRSYDYVRIIAMLFVIGIHAWGSVENLAPSGGKGFSDLIFPKCLGLAVPVFFALSGVVSLDREYTDFLLYYKKRFVTIVIPMLVYAVLYVVYADFETGTLSLKTVSHYFTKIITGKVHGTWWFVYAILGVYFITPFLSCMFLHLTKLQYKVLVFGIYIYLLICTLCFVIGWEFGVNSILFSEQWLYYLFGFFGYKLGKSELSKSIRYMLRLGLIFATVFYLLFDAAYVIAVNTILFCLFALLSKESHYESLDSKGKTFTDCISIQSYDIYLVHAAVLSLCLKIYTDWQGYTHIKFVILVITVAALSFVITYITDKLITNRIQKIIKKHWI